MEKLLTGKDLAEAGKWLLAAAEIARQSGCLKRKCGTVIVKGGDVIGRGFNSLPGNSTAHCQPYLLPVGFKSDKTCCVHAEQRAVMAALQAGENLAESTVYYTSVNENGEMLPSSRPYCTICSKMALDAGVGGWVLAHEDGVKWYAAGYYNQLSFAFGKEAL